jgi:alkaline phosphatase D
LTTLPFVIPSEADSPHLSFVDMGGHGYSIVRASSGTFETEFVCIPRPWERSTTPDGGPLRYRARFRTNLWQRGQTPQMEASLLQGDARFSMD